MAQQRQTRPNRDRLIPCPRLFCGLLVLAILILIAGNVLAAQVNLASAQAAESAAVTPDIWKPDLAVDNSGTAAIVIETGRQRRLYTKNSEEPMNISAAAKIMTALIACERLPMNTMVTISKEAASLPDAQAVNGQVELKNGSKYPLEYLVLRLLFYDCDAAALAIAEQIASVETDFVAVMNQKAANLDLNATHFVNCTGDPVNDPGAAEHPVTTVSDVARLMTRAMQVPVLAGLISKDSEYLVLEGKTVVPMRNQLSALWTRSEQKVTAAFYSEKSYQASTITVGSFKNMNLVTVVANGEPSERIADTLALYNGCDKAYEVSSLVEAGETFSGGQEQTIDGEIFGLVYLKTITYVRPVNDDFLESTIQYRSLGPFSRPIQRGLVVGQVIFTLKDGTVIAADVGPNRQILSNISIIDRALNQLESNENLTFVLLACLLLLIAVLAYQVVLGSIHLVRLVRLLIFEHRSRS